MDEKREKVDDASVAGNGAMTAYVIFFILGIGNLLPWNAFITAAGYFHQRFCNTPHKDNFESVFSFVCTFSQAFWLFAVVKYQNKFSITPQVVIPLGIIASCFLLTTIFVADKEMSGETLFSVTVLLVLITGSVTAWGNGGVVAVAANFPPVYISAVYQGQALAGLMISVLSLITVAANKNEISCTDDDGDEDCSYDSVSYSALSFFILATITLVVCIFAFRILMELPITKYYERKASAANAISSSKSNPDSPNGSSDVGGVTSALAQALLNEGEIPDPADSDQRVKTSDVGVSIPGGSTDAMTEEASFTIAEIWATFKMIQVPALSVFNVFWVTIGVFPALTVEMQSTENCSSDARFYNDLFIPFLFVMFNLGDFTGRTLAGMFAPIFTQDNIWIPSLARWIFVPLFVHCNIGDNATTNIFMSDFFPIFFTLILGVSNGYVTSLCMMFGPSMVPPHRASLASTIMLFLLTWGLLGGAVTSFAWVDLTTK